MRNWLLFNWRYLYGRPPWDSGVSPPELMSFIQSHAPGRAIDLGCGTGTNVLTLALNGWKTTGIDFSPLAIWRARRKLARAGCQADLVVGDVTDLSEVGGPFDLALDIGCFHSLSRVQQSRYAGAIERAVAPSGTYLLYTFLRSGLSGRPGSTDEAGMRSLFGPGFEVANVEHGFFNKQPSAWFAFIRRS